MNFNFNEYQTRKEDEPNFSEKGIAFQRASNLGKKEETEDATRSELISRKRDDEEIRRINIELAKPIQARNDTTDRSTDRALNHAPQLINNFKTGLQIMKEKAIATLAVKKSAVFCVAGKTGSGKTVFANQWREILATEGIRATVISSDEYYQRNESGLDLPKLHSAILQLQEGKQVGHLEPSPILIIEGLQTIEDRTLGQNTDARVYVDKPLQQRIVGRLLRDEQSGFRTVKEALTIVSRLSPEDMERFKNFEKDPEMSNVNIIVKNDYVDQNSPSLYIDGTKNAIVYTVGGQTRDEVQISPSQIPIIAEQIGIDIR